MRLPRFLTSPFPWALLMLLFFWEIQSGILPLKALAITQTSLTIPAQWYTLFTAGLTHRTFFHLLSNTVLLFALAQLFRLKMHVFSLQIFTRFALILNALHGLALSLLIQGITLPTLIYGSSGIVCGLAAFLKRRYSNDNSLGFRILSGGILGVVLFSLADIFLLSQSALSSLSHLLGLIIGTALSYNTLIMGRNV